jgi:hypothetical protein
MSLGAWAMRSASAGFFHIEVACAAVQMAFVTSRGSSPRPARPCEYAGEDAASQVLLRPAAERVPGSLDRSHRHAREGRGHVLKPLPPLTDAVVDAEDVALQLGERAHIQPEPDRCADLLAAELGYETGLPSSWGHEPTDPRSARLSRSRSARLPRGAGHGSRSRLHKMGGPAIASAHSERPRAASVRGRSGAASPGDTRGQRLVDVLHQPAPRPPGPSGAEVLGCSLVAFTGSTGRP